MRSIYLCFLSGEPETVLPRATNAGKANGDLQHQFGGLTLHGEGADPIQDQPVARVQPWKSNGVQPWQLASRSNDIDNTLSQRSHGGKINQMGSSLMTAASYTSTTKHDFGAHIDSAAMVRDQGVDTVSNLGMLYHAEPSFAIPAESTHAPKQPYEWYGKLSGSSYAAPSVTLSHGPVMGPSEQPSLMRHPPQRSLLHGLDERAKIDSMKPAPVRISGSALASDW